MARFTQPCADIFLVLCLPGGQRYGVSEQEGAMKGDDDSQGSRDWSEDRGWICASRCQSGARERDRSDVVGGWRPTVPQHVGILTDRN